MSMNFSQVLEVLNQASAFELFRLQSAIARKLDDPAWTIAVRQRLHVGQTVEYFDAQGNTLRRGRILDLRRKNVAITDLSDGRNWLIDYVCINVDGIDVQVREQPSKGVGRNEVRVGDILGFIDREGRERSGRVIRLNDKTVSLAVDGGQWRVSYSLLHSVIDGASREAIDLFALPEPPR